MTLLDSAKTFLVESLKKMKEKNIIFAILHAVTATELLLKERLSRIHPNLIYKNIDDKVITSGYTVGLKNLPQRLINFGVLLNKKDIDVISTVSKWRHQIVHHMPKDLKRQAPTKLGLLYDFLSRFLEKELDVTLKEFIPTSLFSIASEIMTEWRKVTEDAAAKALKEGNVAKTEECPICGGIETISIRDGEAFCHLCESNLIYGECPFCHKPAIDKETDNEGNVYHWECLDDYARAHFEMMRET